MARFLTRRRKRNRTEGSGAAIPSGSPEREKGEKASRKGNYKGHQQKNCIRKDGVRWNIHYERLRKKGVYSKKRAESWDPRWQWNSFE